MRRPALLAATLTAFALTVSPALAQTDPVPLTGRIVVAGRCPVPLGATDAPCPERPFATTVVIQTADGQPVTAVPTLDDGSFQVSLPAGQYQVEPLLADGTPPGGEPILVEVPQDPVSGLTIQIRGGAAVRE